MVNNIPKIFFSFLVASFLMWLLINLSKEYTSEVIFNLNYSNLPLNKVYKNSPAKELPITIKGTGFNLLSTSFSDKEITLDLEKLKKKNKSKYFLLTKNLNSSIQKQLKSGIQLVQIQTDSVVVELGSLATKRITLKPNVDVSFQLGYDLAKPIEVTPNNILVTGTKEDLKNLTELELEKIELSSINETTSETLKILIPTTNSSIRFKETTAQIKLHVDKFTEGELEIPITLKNVPSKVSINIFPKKAIVTFKVGLNNFNKITSNSFEVICDYKEAANNNTNFLIPKVKQKTKLVSSVRVAPNKIDFLISN